MACSYVCVCLGKEETHQQLLDNSIVTVVFLRSRFLDISRDLFGKYVIMVFTANTFGLLYHMN